MSSLKRKTALVSGAGRGIGRATAVLFAEQGADLALLARSEDELSETADICRDAGAKVFSSKVDLADLSRIDTFIDELMQQLPGVDILINNAAMFDKGPLLQFPVERLRTMLDVNVIAPVYLAQKVAGGMMSGGGGDIVNISSLSGCVDAEKFPGFGAYNISKYALWGVTEMLALEGLDHNLRVNQISLGGVDTRMFREAVPPGVEPALTPAQVARRILDLVLDESPEATGRNIILTETNRNGNG
jgi:3-oxoacyl-[acyl-carrier protein] reductase